MRKYLYVTVFFAGLASLAVEFAASRRWITSVPPTSFGHIIGLIRVSSLWFIFYAGTWRTNRQNIKRFLRSSPGGRLPIGLVPIAFPSHPPSGGDAFDSCTRRPLWILCRRLILLILPITLIGTASPFAIRLAIRIPPSRKVSRRIYAISTLGSFIGTFLLCSSSSPHRTYRTFLVISGC